SSLTDLAASTPFMIWRKSFTSAETFCADWLNRHVVTLWTLRHTGESLGQGTWTRVGRNNHGGSVLELLPYNRSVQAGQVNTLLRIIGKVCDVSGVPHRWRKEDELPH